MLALFFALGRFLSACGASCRVFWPAWLVFMRLGALRARFLRVPGRSGEGFGAPKAIFLHVFSHFGQEIAILWKNVFPSKKNTKIQGSDYKHTMVTL